MRVALLDDHPVVLFGLSAQLGQLSDISVVGSFESSRALLVVLTSQEVDVLVMDYSLGPKEIDGVNLLRMLRLRFPKLEILVVSGYCNPATAALTIRSGARGFIGKISLMHELLDAIRTVAARQRYVDKVIAYELDLALKKVAADDDRGETATLAEQVSLSPREWEVLRCVLDGMAVTSIATKFSRSVTTISTQKQAAYRKLGIRTDAELFKVQHSLGRMYQ
ncbi:response regulator transcription factor [Dyella sp. M7H15-1]|nr:response regulator transcription factor [Dyella sp. M7H15-1]